MIAACLATALLCAQQVQYSLTRELARLELAYEEHVEADDPDAVARVLLKRGELLMKAAEPHEAFAAFEEAELWLDEDADAGLCVEIQRGRASTAILTGRYAEARAAFMTAERHLERGVPEPVRRSLLVARGFYDSMLGSHAEAARHYQEAVEGIAPECAPPSVWLNLGWSLLDVGDWQGAEAPIRTCLERLEHCPDPLVATRADLAMARIASFEGDWAAAEEWHRRAAERCAKHGVLCLQLELDRERMSLALRTGQPALARDLYRESLQRVRAADDPALLVEVLVELQSIALSVDGSALQACERLLLESLPAVDTRNLRALGLKALGNHALYRGDWPGAARLYEEAIQEFRDVPNLAEEQRALLDLAVATRQQGDRRRCCETIARAEALAEQLDIPDALGLVAMIRGRLYLDSKQIPAALECLRRARQFFERSPLQVRRHSARLALVEGLITAREFAEAEPLLDLVEAEGSTSPLDYWQARATGARGEIRMAQGREAEADRLIGDAVTAFHELGFVEDELALLGVRARTRLAVDDLDGVVQLLDRVEELLSRPSTHSLTPFQLAQHQSSLSEWDRIAQDLILRQLLAAEAHERAPVVERGFRQAELWKGRALQESLRRRRASPSWGSAATAGIPDVQRRLLGPDDVLLEFVERSSMLSVYVIRVNRADVIDVAPLADVTALVERFQQAVAQRLDRPALRESGEPLGQLLLAPAGDLAAIPTLWIVPSESLLRLPFTALPLHGSGQDGPMRFVDDAVLVRLAPSASLFLGWPAVGAEELARPALVLAAGGSVRTDSLARGSSGPAVCACGEHGAVVQRSLPGIPHVEDEARDVARVLARVQGGPGTDRVELHVGNSATPELLRSLTLTDYGTIHLAAHGMTDPSSPSRTGLLLSPGEDGDDFLSVTEILEFELNGAVVVLSACETGEGPLLTGEGPLSVAWAFLLAGARGAVASRWPVGDATARRLMTDFMQRRVAGAEDPAQALRAARRALREGDELPSQPRGVGVILREPATQPHVHPRDWAAFDYVGG